MSLPNTSSLFEGVLLIDKPKNCTSHDVVERVRRKLKMKRVGHAGTLDPMATGLLILLLGRATKLSQYLMSLGKVYEGTIKLGEETNTQDAEGTVLATHPVPTLTLEQVRAYTQLFIGDQYQIPPMFSAKKMDGVPLYKLARKGKELEREPRFIHISQFEVLNFSLPNIDFVLSCSKGTYVRTVAHDLGKKIGCGAHLIALRRTATDRFKIDEAVTLENFESMGMSEIRDMLLAPYQVVPGCVL